MKNKNKSIKSRYESYSDERIIEIVTTNRTSYTDEALKLAEEVLAERGIDLEELNVQDAVEEHLEKEAFDATKLELPNNVMVYSKDLLPEENSNLADRINTLVDDIQKNENEIIETIQSNYIALSDEDLRSKYEKIIGGIVERGSFGPKIDEDSIENYEFLLNEFEKRKLKNTTKNQANHLKVVHLLCTTLTKKHRIKGILNIIFGLILIIMGLFPKSIRHVRIISILIALWWGRQRLIVGFKHIKISNEYKKRKNKSDA